MILNTMPHYGFNFQWMCNRDRDPVPQPPDQRALDFMADHGLNYVRLPLDYRFWITEQRYREPDERVLQIIDSYLDACHQRGFRVSLNLHRAPGYCVNRNELEKHNLWTDPPAEDGFVFQWEMFARRYKGISGDLLDFNLLNEPPRLGRFGFTLENHARVMRRTHAAIRAIDPHRPLLIDGIRTGNDPVPDLADLDAAQSARGYEPAAVTHYNAPWWAPGVGLKEPVYPGTFWYERPWDRWEIERYYQPWRELEARGVQVFVGEFGCYNQTPNDVAIRFFQDLFGIYRKYRWGYVMWNFKGPFGIIEHGRSGAKFEPYHGFNVDRALFELYLEHRV